MNKKALSSFLLYFLIITLFRICPLYADDKSTEDSEPSEANEEGEVVDVELARFVANDYLQRFYKGEWVPFNYFICYDLDGIPAAYAFVFRKADSDIKTEEDLAIAQDKIKKNFLVIINRIIEIENSTDLTVETKEQEMANLRSLNNQLTRAQYHPDTFSTVITGASNTSELLIRHYRGLPNFDIKKEEIEAELKNNYPERQYELGHILYFGPIDIRYEVKEGNAVKDASENEKDTKQVFYQEIPDYSYIIGMNKNNRNLITVKTEREKREAQINKKEDSDYAINKKNKSISELEDKKRKYYINEWYKYENIYLKKMGLQENKEVQK